MELGDAAVCVVNIMQVRIKKRKVEQRYFKTSTSSALYYFGVQFKWLSYKIDVHVSLIVN